MKAWRITAVIVEGAEALKLFVESVIGLLC